MTFKSSTPTINGERGAPTINGERGEYHNFEMLGWNEDNKIVGKQKKCCYDCRLYIEIFLKKVKLQFVIRQIRNCPH